VARRQERGQGKMENIVNSSKRAGEKRNKAKLTKSNQIQSWEKEKIYLYGNELSTKRYLFQCLNIKLLN